MLQVTDHVTIKKNRSGLSDCLKLAITTKFIEQIMNFVLLAYAVCPPVNLQGFFQGREEKEKEISTKFLTFKTSLQVQNIQTKKASWY